MEEIKQPMLPRLHPVIKPTSPNSNSTPPLTLPKVILLLFLFLSACRAPKELVLVRVEDWKASQIGIATSTLNGNLVCKNPNSYRITLQDLQAKLSIDGKFLGDISIARPIEIPSSSEFNLPVILQVQMSAFYAAGPSLLLGKEVELSLDGTATGKRSIFTRSLPVKYTGKHRMSDFKL